MIVAEDHAPVIAPARNVIKSIGVQQQAKRQTWSKRLSVPRQTGTCRPEGGVIIGPTATIGVSRLGQTRQILPFQGILDKGGEPQNIEHYCKIRKPVLLAPVLRYSLEREEQQMQPLEKEFRFYKEHQDELVQKYNGKFLAIVGDEVVGVYDSELAAYTEAKKKYRVGTFLIQHCLPGKESYTETYHSRVALR